LAQIELYTGDAEVAWKHVEGQWQALQDSMLLRTQVLRIEAMHLRARAALATSAGDRLENRLRIAEKLAGKIEKENMAWAKPLASLLRAAIAYQRAEKSEAATLLSESLRGFERAEMRLYAAAARRRLGEILGEDKGRQLVKEADVWMVRQRIKNPEAMMRMLAPGF
jgi:hypothetical protein